MKRVKLSFVAIVLGLSLLWLLADTLWPQPFTYFSFRAVFMQYSGVLLMGVMSVAMLLALRPKWLEPHLDGLDKMYRLHKWLGITALVVGLVHWWWGKFTKWMVGWGWLGHQAGQFAFVRSSGHEHAHPYTIASNWNPAEQRIMFIVKALGDHTGRLRERLKVGTPVTVEGPYGCFDFNDAQPRQIWIGADVLASS